MRVFSATELDKLRRKRYVSFQEFFRQLVIAAPGYGVKPAMNHIVAIFKGKRIPGTRYLTLFAYVLECKVDDFFVTKPEKG